MEMAMIFHQWPNHPFEKLPILIVVFVFVSVFVFLYDLLEPFPCLCFRLCLCVPLLLSLQNHYRKNKLMPVTAGED